MKKQKITATVAGVVLLLVSACAPTAAPTSAPAAPTAQAPYAAPATQPVSTLPTSAPAISSEEAAWAQVVAAAQKEGKVTIYSYSFTGDVGIALSRAFTNKYGIKLDIVTGTGAAFLERHRTEKRMGQVTADLDEGSSTNMQSMKTDRLLASGYGNLPVLKEAEVWQLDPLSADPKDRLILAIRLAYYTPYINTNLVKGGEEPKSFNDFLSPKWKGKISVTDPALSPGLYSLLVSLLEEKIIDEDWAVKLGKQDPLFFTSLPEEFGSLARGGHSIVSRGPDTQAARFALEGAPIQAIGMKEGALAAVGTIAAVEGAPHPNATKLFLNWLLTQEGQAIYSRAQGVAPIRKDVADPRPGSVKATASKLLILTPERDMEAARLFREKWLLKLWGR